MRAIHELINVAVHILLIRWQRIQVLCENRCVRYIHLQYTDVSYLPLSETGHMAMLHLG